MFAKVFEEFPLLTLVMTDLGNVVLTPNGTFAHVSFPRVEMMSLPTEFQINELRRTLLRRGGISVRCELSDRSLRVELDIPMPRIFRVLRVERKTHAIVKEVVSWVEPFILDFHDRILGKLRSCGSCYEGKLRQGQTDIATDLWIDVVVESSERPEETELNIRRISQFVESWLEHKPQIDACLLTTMYPEYHRYCDERGKNIRHDVAGFWSQLSVVSIVGNLDGTVVVRYHAGDLFGERRVEAHVRDGSVTCEVAY